MIAALLAAGVLNRVRGGWPANMSSWATAYSFAASRLNWSSTSFATSCANRARVLKSPLRACNAAQVIAPP